MLVLSTLNTRWKEATEYLPVPWKVSLSPAALMALGLYGMSGNIKLARYEGDYVDQMIVLEKVFHFMSILIVMVTCFSLVYWTKEVQQ